MEEMLFAKENLTTCQPPPEMWVFIKLHFKLTTTTNTTKATLLPLLHFYYYCYYYYYSYYNYVGDINTYYCIISQ